MGKSIAECFVVGSIVAAFCLFTNWYLDFNRRVDKQGIYEYTETDFQVMRIIEKVDK